MPDGLTGMHHGWYGRFRINPIWSTAVARKGVKVISESPTGRNRRFRDNRTGEEMTRSEFVKEIERGNYEGYHVRRVHGVKTPVSDPDGSQRNNLG